MEQNKSGQNTSTIGGRLRIARNAKNLSLDEVQELTGIQKSNLSEHENDKSKPSADSLVSLSNAYGVTTDWILKGEQKHDEFKEDTGLYNSEHCLRVPNKELADRLKKVIDSWEKGDEATKGWIMVQLQMEFVEKLKREKRKKKE